MRDGGALPGWPLMLWREKAAANPDMSSSTFDVELKTGRIPSPAASRCLWAPLTLWLVRQ